jgi:glycosyltransferase involved in cell wall biosynthesis
MRLAVEVTTCTPLRAGIGYYTEHLVDALLQTRAPDDELVLVSNRLPAEELARRWAPHLAVGGGRIRAVWLQTDAVRMLADRAVDVAVFPNYIVPLAAPCPTISVVHDLAVYRTPELFTWRKRAVTRALLGRSVESASAVATVSEASRRDIIDRLGVAPERVVLLPGAAHPACGPVSESAIQAVRAKHGLTRPYVLTVGTIEPRKNLLTLLAAYDEIGKRAKPRLPGSGDGDGGGVVEEIDLVVVGGRGWRDRRLLDELEARTPLGRVHWLGYVPEDELIALYGGTRLFVYPSRLEGFGLPVLEAMSCGAPVVASDVAALREVAGDAALLVPPGDVPALVEAMESVLAQPERAERMRALGRLRAQSFSWTRTAQALWKLAHAVGPAREPAARSPSPATPRLVVPGADARAAATISVVPAVSPRPPLPAPVGSPPPGLSSAEWAVLAAVTYADLFDAPLPLEEAPFACIGVALDAAEVRRLVAGRGLGPHVTLHPGGDLTLAGRDALVSRRQEGVVRTARLLERHRRTLAALASLPFVRMLAYSGGTAHQNPGKKPDIDLFVVARPGSLYTVYTLIFLLTKLTRTRRVVCPNYLVDEDELAIVYHRDLFTANQVMSARPLSGPDTYGAFCAANQDWVHGFFPGFERRRAAAPFGGPAVQGAAEALLSIGRGQVERGLRAAWRFYLARRAARARHPDVVLANGILKLHLSDYRRRVLERFAERMDAWRAAIGGGGQDEDPPTELRVGRS